MKATAPDMTNMTNIIWKRIKKNKMAQVGAYITIVFIIISIFAPIISPYDPTEQNFADSLQGPSMKHLFGTDIYGRDVFSRVLYGARTSLKIAAIAVSISLVVGSLLGAIAGFFGRFIDEIIMRFFDVLLAFPSILLAIAIMTILGSGDENLIIALAVYSIPQFARIARSSVLSVKQNEYIEAAKAIGESSWSILFRYILPNSFAPVLVQASMRMATAILGISGLGFLGLGVKPPTPEWGTDLSLALTYLYVAPHLGIFPGLAIFLVVMGFNYLGDGLNDALNPRLKDR